MKIHLITALLLLFTTSSIAGPFGTCPSKAYLFQSSPVQVYGVNLVTGTTKLLQGDTGMDVNINGVGFDFDDNYIYGYDTSNKRIVRLGEDFQAEVVNTSNLPTDHTFYVGDVYNHVYYLYRTGKGLFKIDLSPLDSDPNAVLPVVKITGTANVSLTDFAFHPGTDNLYGVDNNSGILYEFDPTDGSTTVIGDTGETGTFGAGYFDVNGYYYLARNQDGKIYRIDLSTQEIIDSGDVPAILFAQGPSSGQNDGARCAIAPVIDEDSNIDFGDAPDTYSTLLSSNGPRHEIDGLTWLGSAETDGEQDGLISPLSDDTTSSNDEDGVGFVTAVEAGLDAIVVVNASTSGYLTGWIDWNQDGDFADAGEKIFDDELLDAGSNTLFFSADIAAVAGTTWSRFRFSQQTGLDYFGGATSGEVEDHQLTVISEGITVRHFPNESGFATVAYEDNWPYTADYDMNDVVIHYRVTEILKYGEVVKSTITGRLGAYGADYRNGFALRLKGLQRTDVDTLLTRQIHNDVLQEDSGLEADSNEAIFIISNDLSTKVGGECSFFRTEQSCKEDESFTFELRISLVDGADVSSLMPLPYDPFIFAAPGYYHGEALPLHPGRSWEVHLADYEPTEKFDGDSMRGLGEDASDPNTGTYYKTSQNHPWALMMTSEWRWPRERVDIVNAYPEFATYAESAGENATNWHTNGNSISSKVYRD
ncbi:LruC domain-containing protein [Vibrio sp. 10N.261.55.A7]|uniref:LruC domain-containing protein n=1 Tax=Vibrio sp. 10N.261.55.A7 TaxID=1880851 RepID=UPI000C826419|nr:LruC domain-containing protein [Vibrio sp. 10N.261.55.A7]PMK03216.1 LruC domain-containing protein [Vibrio sp. 10N.261.55.A7]